MAGGKTIQCRDYLDLLLKKIEENDEIIQDAVKRITLKKRSQQILLFKANTLSKELLNDWTSYAEKLNSIAEKSGLAVKTTGSDNCNFCNIDDNDIKRVKWGLTESQEYPKTVEPSMNHEEFRKVIR